MRAAAIGAVTAVAAFALIAAVAGIGADEGGQESAGRVAAVESDSGRAVFIRMGCGSCHTLAAAGSRGVVGPDLDQRLVDHDRESLVARIMRSPAEEPETSSAMPTNFRERLSERELDELVGFLLAARDGG
jgi:cytochrome c oxidase subunit II